ncbi:rab-like protein 3 [Drosophila miranda]|uniref:rab-like protein 3 n=1 Tax=Drosophila miranda TaxID=7229 RepID=UPI0007E649D2|nr:rab-like protein 3 [Drosophila miranda]
MTKMANKQRRKQELQQIVEDVRTVRILILGDPGVGKSSLTNLLASSPITPTRSSRTVADSEWTVQARLHEYPRAHLPLTPEWTSTSSSDRSAQSPLTPEELYFVEFYDKNDSVTYDRVDRNPLYKNMDGIILVYNMQDMETHDHLHDWIYGPLREITESRQKRMCNRLNVPILVVGTMLDKLRKRRLRRSGNIAYQLGSEEIFINCCDQNAMSEMGRNYGKLRNFLNRAVDFGK